MWAAGLGTALGKDGRDRVQDGGAQGEGEGQSIRDAGGSGQGNRTWKYSTSNDGALAPVDRSW